MTFTRPYGGLFFLPFWILRQHSDWNCCVTGCTGPYWIQEAIPPMKTQTTINGVEIIGNEAGYYDLTSAKGKEIIVTFSNGQVWVKVINASAKAYAMSSGNLLGKPFACIGDAVESYKNADVKHALRVLVSSLV